ncbi:hypothetical protein GXP67_05250 [Rhodocytophaga rosea]|uniref:Uncharacterized protein n=1 Tax=Rhodocytophaga rosea TaxID=2704465 RepID=A0A6C0GDW9_9BACT|nr:hypothetical protein [Rhodocytophaga rosea]QHT66117.1 hypothetical protein GXP67_05250 [Rhodocytophaga rosea]
MKTALLVLILFFSVGSLFAGSTFQTVGEIGLMVLSKLLKKWSKDRTVSKNNFFQVINYLCFCIDFL